MAQTKTSASMPNIDPKYQYQYRADYSNDWDTHSNYIQDNFDAWEAMLIGQVYDSVSGSIDGSKITDSYSTTLAKERADRVIAKLPEGVTEPIGKSDIGKAAFMDILRQKWIYPNANSQHSFLEKLNMWQFYSSVYGYMPMFYDWNVNVSGYVGPDCWLWNPRNLVPQQGRTSINDMDYVTALTWVGKKYLQDILNGIRKGQGGTNPDGTPVNEVDTNGWDVDALELLIQIADQKTTPNTDKDTKIARDRTPNATRKGVCLATRYEAGEGGKWVTFAPENAMLQVRELENPHKNGRIPFVIKYSQPLFDSFYGLGDFQRAKPLQFARDGLTNFYFKGIKMNLIPPIVANANGVVKHTLDYREGAVMMETIPNSIRRLETSTAGLATYQAAQSNLTGSLLSLYGSQNASISSGQSLNPEQGKTPQAIDLYSDKEADRDGSERRHLIDAIQQLTTGFFSLVANIGTEHIPITIFQQDIEDIVKSGMADVEDLFTKSNTQVNQSGTAAVLKIDPAKLKGIDFRFIIDPDSTALQNKAMMLQALKDFITQLGAVQNVITEDPTMTVHWDRIMQSYESLTGIPNASTFITHDPTAQVPPPPASQPSQSAVTMPGGQIHELADLGKMFAATVGQPGYEDVQNALLQAMGVQATVQPVAPPEAAPVGPTVSASGHAFNDASLAQAATALHSHFSSPLPPTVPQPEAPAAPAPMVAASGHAFVDPTVGGAASAITNLARTSPPMPKAEPASATSATIKK